MLFRVLLRIIKSLMQFFGVIFQLELKVNNKDADRMCGCNKAHINHRSDHNVLFDNK